MLVVAKMRDGFSATCRGAMQHLQPPRRSLSLSSDLTASCAQSCFFYHNHSTPTPTRASNSSRLFSPSFFSSRRYHLITYMSRKRRERPAAHEERAMEPQMRQSTTNAAENTPPPSDT